MRNAFYAVSSTMLLLPAVVAAQYSVGSAPSGMASTGDTNQMIINVINWFLTILASLAVLMIVVSGILYITAAGNEGRIDTAKSYLTYSVIGLVVALLGWVIVRTVSSAIGAG